MSANIKASVDGTQAIIGVGGVDQMTVSNLGVVTANSFVGNVTGGGTFSGNASSATALATGSTTARTLANRFAEAINVLDFGADPTGATNTTSQINDAIDYGIQNNKTVYIPSGTYQFDGYTNTSINAFEVSIIGDDGNEPTLIANSTAANAGLTMLSFPDTRYSNVTGLTLSGDVNVGQSVFTLTSVAGLSVGMVIQISTSREWYNGSRYNALTGTGKFCGEIHKIVGIVGNKVYIEDYTRDVYSPTDTSYDIVIRAWNPCKVTIKNINLESPYPPAGTTSVGIQIQQSVNSIVENVKLKGFTQRCISDKLTINSKYTNIVFEQTASMPNSGVNGYGLATDGSLGLLLDGLKANGQRRSFDADCIDGVPSNGSAPWIYPGINGPARDWQITNFVVNGGGAWLPSDLNPSAFSFGIGMHGGSENGIISNGYITDCTTGINCRGRNTTIDNVVFSGPFSTVINIYEDAAGLTVQNCTYDSLAYPNKNNLDVYSITVTNGGSGYATVPDVVISPPSSGVTATATATISAGAVTNITVNLNGSGYTEPPSISFTGGGGSGAVARPVMDFVTPASGCDTFVSFGINSSTGFVNYDIPIVIQNNIVKGVIERFAYFWPETSNSYAENIIIKDNRIETIARNGGTCIVFDAGSTVNLNTAQIVNNNVKVITGIVQEYDSSLVLGVAKSTYPDVNVFIDNAYFVKIADDSVVKIPKVIRSGDRLLASLNIRNNAATLIQISPASTSFTILAGSSTGIAVNANGPSLNGTTGTDTNVTFGLFDGDLWIENRSGSERDYRIQVIG
jgi:hypothetical protein